MIPPLVIPCLQAICTISDCAESIRTLKRIDTYRNGGWTLIAYCVNELYIGIGGAFIGSIKAILGSTVIPTPKSLEAWNEIKKVMDNTFLPSRIISIPLGIQVSVSEQDMRIKNLTLIRYIPMMKKACAIAFPLLFTTEVIVATLVVEACCRVYVWAKF